jgi:23S rRNA (uracil1939-C5)-methyltransferase
MSDPEQNPEFELKLTSMAHGGSALGKADGKLIFVPYALPGEQITARITQDKGRFAFAEGIMLYEPSPDRVRPRCPHFGPGRCGGCHWQHIDYPAQLRFKAQIVRDQFARLGGIADAPVKPTIPSPEPWNYRSHVTFSLTQQGKLGFVSTDNMTVIPIEECHIIRPELLDLFEQLDLEGVPTLDRVRMQVGSDPTDRLLLISTTDDEPPEVEIDIPASVNFLLSDNEPFNLIGATHVRYTIRDKTFRVTAGGFFQVNLPQAETLVDLVMERLALTGKESVLDLYSGVGLFSAFIADNASLVVSVESYPPAVTDADENLASYENVELIEGSVEDVLDSLEGPFDAAVVDPPRQGLADEALTSLIQHRPRVIVYVSCDPATLARDARRLVSAGYHMEDVQPVDMFPQTFHIEAVATFQLGAGAGTNEATAQKPMQAQRFARVGAGERYSGTEADQRPNQRRRPERGTGSSGSRGGAGQGGRGGPGDGGARRGPQKPPVKRR